MGWISMEIRPVVMEVKLDRAVTPPHPLRLHQAHPLDAEVVVVEEAEVVEAVLLMMMTETRWTP